jgi:hypothetical protein
MAVEVPCTVAQLLDASAFKEKLEALLPAAKQQTTIASAYLTKPGAQWLSSLVPRVCKTTLVVRWRLSDLLSGCSDLETYEIATRNAWTMRIHQDLHAKVWLIDRTAMLVGSGNATASGLALVENGNWEYGVHLVPREADVRMLQHRVEESVLLTDALFQRIRAVVQASKQASGAGEAGKWPDDLAQVLQPSNAPTALWVAECFQTDGSWLERVGPDTIASALECVDLSLLGTSGDNLKSSMNKAALTNAFKDTALFRWLTKKLTDAPHRELYFGELSAALHDALADDPKPYRQTVKGLLSNLLCWISMLEIAEIRIDAPRYSQRVALLPDQLHT